MDFKQDEMHEELLKMYREFAENTVKPLAAEIDREERYPEETVKQMAEMNMKNCIAASQFSCYL